MDKENHLLPGLIVIEPQIYTDDRGHFFESYQKEKYAELGINDHFVQDNEAFSHQHVLRGLHYQTPPFTQSKLVRVVFGEVLDIVVDIREGSATYGRHFSIRLSDDNKRQLYIPSGFAHGYVVLSKGALFQYKTDNYFSKENEAGIYFGDTNLNINWIVPNEKLIISEKDSKLPTFGNHNKM